MGIEPIEASLFTRLWRFVRKPWTEQRRSILSRLWRWVPGAVVPIRLPFGPWWLGQYEYSTDLILTAGYEQAETAFIQKFLRSGMTFLDVGANRGYYTLLASQKVGHDGRVIAFEPSPRERLFLRINLLLNHCRNVRLEPIALGNECGQAALFVVEGYSTGCNSLRSRKVQFGGYTTSVQALTLDGYVGTHGIARADLLKMDIEGGELEVIKGAVQFLTRRPRPIVLCELIDQLTQLWGYEPSETVEYLQRLGFVWFSLCPQGTLEELSLNKTSFDGNFVALPEEKLSELRKDGWLPDLRP